MFWKLFLVLITFIISVKMKWSFVSFFPLFHFNRSRLQMENPGLKCSPRCQHPDKKGRLRAALTMSLYMSRHVPSANLKTVNLRKSNYCRELHYRANPLSHTASCDFSTSHFHKKLQSLVLFQLILLHSPPLPQSISKQWAWEVIKYQRLNLLDQLVHFQVKLSK